MRQLNDLPPELILLIIDNLSFLDSLSFRATCKEYYEVVEDSFSALKLEEIALTFQSSQNMSAYSREEIRNKIRTITNNLYPKQQEKVKTFNVLDTTTIQSESARCAICVPTLENMIDRCKYPRAKNDNMKLDDYSTVKYKIDIRSIPIKNKHEGLKMLEIRDIHHWELLPNNNIIKSINIDADVKIFSFKEIFSRFDYQIHGEFEYSGTMTFPRQKSSSVKISRASNYPLSESYIAKEVRKWNIPIATETSLGTLMEVKNILKDNINEFTTSHGKYLINVGLVSEDDLDDKRFQYKKQMLAYLNEVHFWDSGLHVRLTGDAVTFTCYNRQLEDSISGNTSKRMWKVKLKVRADDIFIGIKDDLEIQFLDHQFVMIPINIITMNISLDSRSNSNYPYGSLFWYVLNLSTGEYVGCFNMEKNRFGSNPGSELIDWRINQTGQIFLDGANVFTIISDYLPSVCESERKAPATILNGYVEPLLQKILAMPLNSFLLVSQVDKFDEMLIKNISFQLEIDSHNFNNDNELYIPFRKKNFKLKEIPTEQIKWKSIFEIPIGYGANAQEVPHLAAYGHIPKFHFKSRFALCMDYKYFWNNKIIILAHYLVYKNEASERINDHSEVYMFICYDFETKRHRYIKLGDLECFGEGPSCYNDFRAEDMFMLFDDELNFKLLEAP